MAFEGQISDLIREDTIDSNKILSDLLDPKNLDMKTDIRDPITFSILESLVSEIEELLSGVNEKKLQLPITKKLLKNMLVYLKKFLVSWERKSRIEITETLKATKEQESGAKSLFQKIAGFGGT